jgi:peptidoglycan/xylan/chitin deacetylase (PgdA/CDA1 family)
MRRILCLVLCLTFLIFPVQAAQKNEKYVALTFDDGPSGRFTRRLLDGLAERDAKATFFLCGYRIAQYPKETQRIFDEGHEIALHGYSHDCMTPMSRRQIAKELSDTKALLPEGCKALWLRPPGGCCSDGVRQVAEVTNLSILDWSVDPRDWATRDTAAVGRFVVERIQDGDVVLLHDMSDSSVDAALAIIDELQSQGFRFVTVSELVKIRDVNIKPGKIYRKFPPS